MIDEKKLIEQLRELQDRCQNRAQKENDICLMDSMQHTITRKRTRG